MALAIQTTLTGFSYDGTAAVDLVLVLPIYIALTSGAGAGLLAASLAGLFQDSLSSGILGIGALAKTIVAYLAGVASTQFILNGLLQRFVTFFLGNHCSRRDLHGTVCAARSSAVPGAGAGAC